MGLAIPTMVRVIVERVAPVHAGLVGGMFNSTLQVSAAVGIAVIGGLFFTALGARTDPAAITHAFAITLFAIAACHIGGALLAIGLGQRRIAPLPIPPSPTTCPNPGR
jgi:predicted MFS family arabinose efflux permease